MTLTEATRAHALRSNCQNRHNNLIIIVNKLTLEPTWTYPRSQPWGTYDVNADREHGT